MMAESVDGKTAGDVGNSLHGWFKKTTATLGEHVKEIQANTKVIAADFAGGVQKVQESLGQVPLKPGEERVDVVFAEGSLGLDLRGNAVRGLIAGGQAEALGVLAEDKLVCIGGEFLPGGDATNNEMKEAISQLVRKYPRPIDMVFVRVTSLPDIVEEQAWDIEVPLLEEAELVDTMGISLLQANLAAARQAMETSDDELKAAHDAADAARADAEGLRVELELSKVWSNEEVQRSQEDVSAARVETEKVRTELHGIRLERSAETIRIAELEAEVRQVAELRAELMRVSSSSHSADASPAATTAVVQLSELRVEMERLRAVQAESAKAASEERGTLESELQSLQVMCSEKEAQLRAEKQQIVELQADVDRFQAALAEEAHRSNAAAAEASVVRAKMAECQDTAAEAVKLRETATTLSAELERLKAVSNRESEVLRAEVDGLRAALTEEAKRSAATMVSLKEEVDEQHAGADRSKKSHAEEIKRSNDAAASAREEARSLRAEMERLQARTTEEVQCGDATLAAARMELRQLREESEHARALLADQLRRVEACSAAAAAQVTALKAELERVSASSAEGGTCNETNDAEERHELSELRVEMERLRALGAEESKQSENIVALARQEAGALRLEVERLQTQIAEDGRLHASSVEDIRREQAETVSAQHRGEATIVATREEASTLRLEVQKLQTANSDNWRRSSEESSILRNELFAQQSANKDQALHSEAGIASANEETIALRTEVERLQKGNQAAMNLASDEGKGLRAEMESLRVAKSEELQRAEATAVSLGQEEAKWHAVADRLKATSAEDAQRSQAALHFANEKTTSLRAELDRVRAATLEASQSRSTEAAAAREEAWRLGVEVERLRSECGEEARQSSVAVVGLQEELAEHMGLAQRACDEVALVETAQAWAVEQASEWRTAAERAAVDTERVHALHLEERQRGEEAAAAASVAADETVRPLHAELGRLRTIDADYAQRFEVAERELQSSKSLVVSLRAELRRLASLEAAEAEAAALVVAPATSSCAPPAADSGCGIEAASAEEAEPPPFRVDAIDLESPAEPPAEPKEKQGLSPQVLLAGQAEERLMARLKEVEEENNTMRRQLDGRPIVFQYSPNDGDIPIAPSFQDTSDDVLPVGQLTVGTALLACCRRTARGCAWLRKQKLSQTVERFLRGFTQLLLKQPLLLWLFYAQLFVLWLVEFWRQAAGRSYSNDPMDQLAACVKAAAAAPAKGTAGGGT